jgi:hypothetical protein
MGAAMSSPMVRSNPQSPTTVCLRTLSSLVVGMVEFDAS